MCQSVACFVGTATDYHCPDSRCCCSLTSFLLTTATHINRISSCIYTRPFFGDIGRDAVDMHKRIWDRVGPWPRMHGFCHAPAILILFQLCLKAAVSFACLVHILLVCTKPHSQNLSICFSVSSFSTCITAPPPLNIICARNHLFAWGTCGASLTSSSTAADCCSFQIAVRKLVLHLYDKQCTMLNVNNHIIQSYCRI